MQATERKLNPFINSPAGGRALSAMQLPFFLVRPPMVYVVAIKGKTQWAKERARKPRCAPASAGRNVLSSRPGGERRDGEPASEGGVLRGDAPH
jgi:hypothetical protein